MNAARLTRRWQEAAGDPVRMVEAPVDKINDPAIGRVTRDFLRAELAQLRAELAQVGAEIATLRGETVSSIAELESRLTWRMMTMLGAQVVLVGILVTILFQVLR
jgi:deoxyribodipyrimidine photolyase